MKREKKSNASKKHKVAISEEVVVHLGLTYYPSTRELVERRGEHEWHKRLTEKEDRAFQKLLECSKRNEACFMQDFIDAIWPQKWTWETVEVSDPNTGKRRKKRVYKSLLPDNPKHTVEDHISGVRTKIKAIHGGEDIIECIESEYGYENSYRLKPASRCSLPKVTEPAR